ncbi:Hypothetical protein A7982_00829 [Minicystis rosea]|nr:Hypothetical protein A7982_00829 [Minicystis rosea]
MTSFFRVSFFVYTTVVVLIGAGAYAGVLPTTLSGLPHADLLLHFLFIGGVAFFADGALRHRPLWRRHGSLGGFAVIVVAGIEEWAQRFSPRRSSTWSDFTADVLGVILFVWLSRRVTAKLQTTQPIEQGNTASARTAGEISTPTR